MGREKSDDPVVPQGLRKLAPTADPARGGKGITASERAVHSGLLGDTAANPQGAGDRIKAGQPADSRASVPKSSSTKGEVSSAMSMEEVADKQNLRRAFEKVASNKGAAGPDRQSIATVRSHLEGLLPGLHESLLDGTYRPGLVRRVWIPKPGGQRALGIPNVIDRMVQQAVHQVIAPWLNRGFHGSSHGFRLQRSCHTAITEARRHIADGHEWVADIDLTSFFDRVHHQRLLARLERLGVSDRRVLRLIQQMLKAKVVMPDGVVVSSEEGTPQGGPLSPLLSNVVLDELDWELERRGHRFVRYADDCNIYVRSERAGQRVMASLKRFIEGRLRLEINTSKSAVGRPEDRHFVGFRFKRSSAGEVTVHLSARSKARVGRRIVELTRRNVGESLPSCIERLNRYLEGWLGFFQVCSEAEATRVFRGLDAHIRRRLRARILRQKKNGRNRMRWLVSCGVPRAFARKTAYANAGLWAMSAYRGVHKALPNVYFRRKGLFSLLENWKLREAARIARVQLEIEWVPG